MPPRRILRRRLDRLGLRLSTGCSWSWWAGTPRTAHWRAIRPRDLPEVQLRVAVRSHDRRAVERFSREIAPLVLTGPPSVTGFAGGRPRVQEIMAYWPALIDRSVVEPGLSVDLVEV